jgi:hypothetical protein
MIAELNEAGPGMADLVASTLRETGWDIEDRQVHGSASAAGIRRGLGYLGYSLGISLAFLLSLSPAPLLLRALAWGLAVAWWVLLTTHQPRRPWRTPPLRPARFLIARRPSEARPSCRIVIQAPLGEIGVGETGVGRSRIGMLMSLLSLPLLVVTFFNLPPGFGPAGQWAGGGCIVGIWGTVLIGVSRGMIRPVSEGGPPDTRSLAFLVELGGSWRRGHSERIETILAAVGGQQLERAGDHAMRRMIREEWPLRPTLMLSVLAPGAGGELIIAGTELVRLAADALWIPHREAVPGEIPAVVYPLDGEAETAVVAGAGWNEPHDRLDPEALGRTAQLLTEVALRWARLHATPETHPAGGRNDARSPQKPG